MRNNLLIFFFLLASNSFAQDCRGLKENEEYRLDKNDGPLVNAHVQDQDGLGTCFANSASVALQSALPGNPDVSYLQLAFSYAQMEVAPQNKNRDSAYVYSDRGEKGDLLINGGTVCQTIEAAKSDKIGGVCSRDDVALEKSLFNPAFNASTDPFFVQKKVVAAVSDYYDSIKEKFGISSAITNQEIAKRTLAFSNYKKVFEKTVKANQDKFSRDACLKPDISNSEMVYKNLLVKQYTYLKNKYGDANSSKAYEKINGKPNPDRDLFFYYIGMGSVYSFAGDNELSVSVSKKITETLKNNYIAELSSGNPPKDAVTAFRNALIKVEDKKDAPQVDKIIADLSPSDKELLAKDYNLYVKKDVSNCMPKKSFEYYKSADGLIQDFSNDVCLKNYLYQGRSLQALAEILDRLNWKNIDTLNSFMNKLPTLSYEEAMRAILAPDCSDAKKIKIPKSLNCDSTNFDYLVELRKKLTNEGNISSDEIDNKIQIEEEKEKQAILAVSGAPPSIVSRKLSAVHVVASGKVLKQLAGNNEQKYWDDYVSSNKRNFNLDAISLLKDKKQAVPLTLCTRVFSSPNATALRDGQCEQDSGDGGYQSVGGFHSVVAVGVRCQNGKLNYLIQNSWGSWDSLRFAKDRDGAMHFEREYGKAWMSEDEIMNNTYGYQKITK